MNERYRAVNNRAAASSIIRAFATHLDALQRPLANEQQCTGLISIVCALEEAEKDKHCSSNATKTTITMECDNNRSRASTETQHKPLSPEERIRIQSVVT